MRAGPLVSVIVPAYNAASTLRESVQSALDGSHANIEVIIVDDGSADGTAQVAEALVRSDARVRLHRRDQGGVSAALNAGLALARGDYIARLDADDIWHPAKLERQIELAARDAAAAFIYTFVRHIDGEGRVVRDAPQQLFPRHALCRGIYESLIGGNSSALIKRSVVEAAGGYDEGLSSWEDLLLQLRINARHPIAWVPEYLVGYRVRPGSLSADPANMLRSWREARRRIDRLFPAVPGFVRNWAHGRRCAELAEGFAWRRKPACTASLLIEAARHDPVWTARFLGHRTLRHLRRRLGSSDEPAPGPAFLACRSDEQVGLGNHDQGLEGSGLQRLETKRNRHLAELDERLWDAGA